MRIEPRFDNVTRDAALNARLGAELSAAGGLP